MKYYIAKVKVVTTDDKGRQKKMVEQYCVNAVSVTDAEAKVHEEFETEGGKIYDNVFTTPGDNRDSYIHKSLTASLNKK